MRRLLIRFALYVGGMLLILALTASHFDHTEWFACGLFACLVAASEAVLRSTKNGGDS